MKAKERVVIDTNALVSRLLLPGSILGQAVRKAVAAAQPLASDDTIIELAVNGAAQLIITGDADLLALHPFRGIDILAPAHYLAR
jgi:predicted nucleic acid-binding protein